MLLEVAHDPATGEKIYVNVPSVEVVICDGDQVPANPLVEVVFRAVGVWFKQNGPTGSKVGSTLSETLTVIFLVAMQEPAFGVKVKVNVPGEAVLICAGDQVPVIPLAEVLLSAGGASPTHKDKS